MPQVGIIGVPLTVAPLDGRRQPGDVPAPDLVGGCGAMGRQGAGLGRAAATSPERLPCSPEHPVEGRFAGQVGPLVRKLGHDLVGRQTGAVASIGRLQDSLALCFAEFVARHFALGCGPAIEGSYAPALQGSLFQAQFAAGLGLPGSGSNRFVNQLDGFAAI